MSERLTLGSLGLLAAIGAAGCRDLERFDTSGDDVYCGKLVGASFQTGFLPDGAESETVRMSLELDVSGLARYPGRVRTDDALTGLCAPKALLRDARLRAVSEAFHDPVSQLDFGDGREHNLLVWVDSTCVGSLFGILSLMRDDSVELRLFKPAPEPDDDTRAVDRPGFAEFRLTRRHDACGF